MKKVIFLFCLMFLVASLSAAYQFKLKHYPFYTGLNVNLFRLSGNNSPGSLAKLNYGGMLGYNYTPHLAFELAGSYGYTKGSDPEASGLKAWTSDNTNISINTSFTDINFAMRYNLLPELLSNPYVKIGLGHLSWSPDENSPEFSENSSLYGFAGMGLENRISDHFSFNINICFSQIFKETKNIFGTNGYVDESIQNDPDNVNEIGIGFTYNFGHGVIEKVSLKNIEAVTFQFNSIKVTPESKKIIDYIVEAMKRNPDLVLEVRGYTDNTGSDAVNLRMSKKRAMAVKQMIVDRGITPTRLIISAMGHQNPVATNSTPEGRAMNRRVEFFELQK